MKTKRSIITIAALVTGFIGLASGVLSAATEPIDHAILQAFRTEVSDPAGPLWLERTVLNLSALGSAAVTTLLVSVAALFLMLDKRPRQALLLIGATSIAALGMTGLKLLIGRERPTIVEHIEVVGGLSFPSGHTLLAAVLYPTLGMLIASNLRQRHLKAFVFGVAALLALVVGLTRVYLGVHYPSDVLGGWLLGLAFAVAAGVVIQALKKKHIVERPFGETAGDEVGPIP
ncbi:MAG: phosphatase PAP2 family protein [Deltaproteobacteria bacterium]|nr:phosphatase PAP2 family protein [Deltaproteobacteria bacterium]